MNQYFCFRPKRCRRSGGFSLVELAISVTVVGVLLGLVVGGVGLLDSSRIASTVTQIDTIQKSVNVFRDTYHAMPGDLNRATSLIDNCNATFLCGNGDGNGAIGTGDALDVEWNEGVSEDDETLYAWRHLSLSQIMPEASGRIDMTGWGYSHPRSSFGGGVEIFYDADHSFLGDSHGVGHYLRYADSFVESELESGDGLLALSARGVDRKIDDGNPFLGRVTSAGEEDSGCFSSGSVEAYEDYTSAQSDLDSAQSAFDAAVASGSAPAIASAQNDLDGAQATYDLAASDYAAIEEGYNVSRFGSGDCFLFVKLRL